MIRLRLLIKIKFTKIGITANNFFSKRAFDSVQKKGIQEQVIKLCNEIK